MMASIPDLTTLIAGVVGNAIAQFQGFLGKNRSFVASHNNFDEFIDKYITAEEDADGEPSGSAARIAFAKYKGANNLLMRTREDLIRVLWAHEIFVSTGTVDRILFGLACDGSVTDIGRTFFEFVLNKRLHEPGFILYPIHSFGIQGFGFATLVNKQLPDINLSEAGIYLAAQTNDPGGTMAFLDRARTALGVSQSVPASFASELNQDHLAWAMRNPLLALKFSSTTSSFFENQFVIMVKLQFATALVHMLAALGQTDRSDRDSKNLSTARTNNWQTLDINHYIVFETRSIGDELEVLRTPMNISRSELTALSEINVDVDPHDWSTPGKEGLLTKIRDALGVLESGYISDWVLGDKKSRKSHVLRKLFLSIGFFHRSFRSAVNRDEAVVSLAIAFETLLTDGYQRGGVKARVARRVPLCIAGEPDHETLESEVQRLMEYRGKVVHEGASEIAVDLNAARRAYVHCLIRVIEGVGSIRQDSSQPVGEILGDVGDGGHEPEGCWSSLRAYLSSILARKHKARSAQ
ncbi:HEPN domain-containing protein [Rhizobium laguerreae]|uniref:HEPN domain-containing protein n=1 Tax=Rhizobium laguerreae TaxID=1076926 RepID=UPI001C909B10|nr:HEPN domain-containing protein [Rhizobium laguerreae]MBY3139000.1 hypothetical protein [Rhizobium laguerreae]